MPQEGDIYFAWVASGTPFDPTVHNRSDLTIIDWDRSQKENECAILTLKIQNPRTGLNITGGEQWCWFSIYDGTTPKALFNGRVVSVPTNLFAEILEVKFVAMPSDMLAQKQAYTTTNLSALPNFDPVMIEINRRLDPDSYLQAISACWYVNPLTGAVSTSDFLVGEDGVVDILEDRIVYDTFNMTIDRAPKKSVFVNANINWTQRATGVIDMQSPTFETYAGDAILKGWPKTLASLGGGWTVKYAAAYDTWNIEKIQTVTTGLKFQNTEKTHAFGDTMSSSVEITRPVLSTPYKEVDIVTYNKIALMDPSPGGFADPTAETRTLMLILPKYNIATSLQLEYDAQRQRTENIRFTLGADLQPVFTDPGGAAANFAQDSVMLDVAGSVGLEGPYGTFRGNYASTTFYAKYDYFMVNIGGIEYCYQATRDHTSQPTFDPRNTASFWEPGTLYGSGEPVYVGGDVYNVLVSHKSAGSFSATALDGNGNLIYQLQPDPFGGPRLYAQIPNFKGNWAASTIYVPNDIFIAPITGVYYRVLIGHTAASSFDQFATDTAGRLLLALLLNPPPIGDVSRRSYLNTDRGQQTLEYLVLWARSILIQNSRVVNITCEVPVIDALSWTLRMNATVTERRLPGGSATGKIVGLNLFQRSGGGPRARIELACCVGNGNSLTPVTSDGVYTAVTGYMQPGYQQETNSYTVVGAGDVQFSLPGQDPIDDGLIFPLDKKQAVKTETFVIASVAEEEAVEQAYLGAQLEQKFTAEAQAGISNWILAWQEMQAYWLAQQEAYIQALANVPAWYRFTLAPVVNGPFNTEYILNTSLLMLPKQIDLSAPHTADSQGYATGAGQTLGVS